MNYEMGSQMKQRIEPIIYIGINIKYGIVSHVYDSRF